MVHQFGYFTLAATLMGAVSCTSATDVGQAERKALLVSTYKNNDENCDKKDACFDLDNYNDLLKYGVNLSLIYIDLSDNASAGSDLYAVGTIAAAAVTAGGLLFGSHPDLIRGAGLFAGTATGIDDYLEPDEASEALLTASEQVHCVVLAARTHLNTNPDLTDVEKDSDLTYVEKRPKFTEFTQTADNSDAASDPEFSAIAFARLQKKAATASDEANQIMRDAFRSVQLSLRKKLRRELPNYRQLVEDFRAAVIDEEQTKDDMDGGDVDDPTTPVNAQKLEATKQLAESLAKFKTKVAECVATESS